MRTLYGRFRGWSIRRQFMVFFALLLVLCVILSVTLTGSTQRLFLQNSLEYAATVSAKLMNDLTYATKQIMIALEYLQQDRDIQNLLQLPYAQYGRDLLPDVRTKLIYTVQMNGSIHSFTLVSDSVHMSELYTVEDMDAMRAMVDGSGQVSSLGVRPASLRSAQGREHLVMGRMVTNTQTSENLFTPIGAVFASVDLGTFVPATTREESPYTGFYLLDGGTRHAWSLGGSGEISQTLYPQLDDVLAKANQAPITLRTDTETVFVDYLPDAGLYLVSVVDTMALGRTLLASSLGSWGIVFVLLAFVVLFMAIAVQNIIRPLRHFGDVIVYIRDAEDHTLDAPLELTGCREIAEIGAEFSDMMGTVAALNREMLSMTTNLYELELEKQQAEMAFLQSQTNPHFLYNTLEMMRGIALEQGNTDVAEISQQMGTLMRYSIKGDPVAPLRDELAITQAYLNIQQRRFRGRLFVFYNFPDELLGIPVIRMVLQPIVENAIIHGFEGRTGEGNLYVGAKREGGDLIVSVLDDGDGISPERLSALREMLEMAHFDPGGRHIGLRNTHARLRAQYGAGYGIGLESDAGQGTRVTIRIPVTDTKEETACTAS